MRATYPEVLTSDWLPPTALDRQSEVHSLVRLLGPESPPGGSARIVAVSGPPGSGTSTVARRAARDLVDRVRTTRGGVIPLTVTIRVRWCRGTQGLASALVQRLDEGFHGRGFPVVEILAGFLRRLRRANRAAVIVLEDIDIGGPSIAPVLQAFCTPDRFLPEGESGVPPIWIVLAGASDVLALLDRELPQLDLPRASIRLRPYTAAEIGRIIEERAQRSLGCAPPPELARRVAERAQRDGGGARRAMELLRRELSVAGSFPPTSMGPLKEGWSKGIIEPRVLWALDRACQGASASVADVRAWEARLAREGGCRPLAATTFWRRMIRLEQAGVVRREVRPGGDGGTRTTVRLLVPIEAWAKNRGPADTRPVFEVDFPSGTPRLLEGSRPISGLPEASHSWIPFDPGVPARAPTRPAEAT